MTEQVETIADEWFYGLEGTRVGPLSRDELVSQTQKGILDKDAVVWKTGMDQWIKLADSEFAPFLKKSGPPPLTVAETRNGYIWALATAPLWGTVCQILITHIWAEIKGGFVFYSSMWWVVAVCNIVTSILDFKSLKAAGHDVTKLKGWMLFMVPVYIYQRDKLLGADMTRFWIWIGAWVISMFLI